MKYFHSTLLIIPINLTSSPTTANLDHTSKTRAIHLIKFMFCECRLPHSNYLHRMPRTSHYQTTPFTIDPSARSTQTFAERYGVSPPHSNENLYGNDYTIIGHDDKCSVPRVDRQARNHKVELSKPSSSSNIIQQAGSNNNNSGADPSKASKSSVIKGSAITPNNTHSTAFDVEHRLQVSLLRRMMKKT